MTNEVDTELPDTHMYIVRTTVTGRFLMLAPLNVISAFYNLHPEAERRIKRDCAQLGAHCDLTSPKHTPVRVSRASVAEGFVSARLFEPEKRRKNPLKVD